MDLFRVVPEDLRVSATKVVGHAGELEARHCAAHGRIEAAQAGVPAAAAAALTAAVAKWHADSAVLFTNLTKHGGALGDVEINYAATEGRSSEAIGTVGSSGSMATAEL